MLVTSNLDVQISFYSLLEISPVERLIYLDEPMLGGLPRIKGQRQAGL